PEEAPDTEWEEYVTNDGKTAYRNRATGDVSDEKPDDLKTAGELAREQAKKRMQQKGAKGRRRKGF
ncbi:MAG: hypothetical protein AAFS07_19015, partial [Pseudomonadota bacterium]